MTSPPRSKRSNDSAVVAIDVGKTKILAGVFTPSSTEIERRRIEVSTVGDTLTTLTAYIEHAFNHYPVKSIGLSIFGPLETELEPGPFGAITGSSEPQWSGVNLPSSLTARFDVPVMFDFDVNAGALAESRHQAAASPSFVYLSVGTGIGGVFWESPTTKPQPAVPPQVGHIYLPQEPDDPYSGSCRFHGNCFQGLASGRAIFGRWKIPAHELPADHEAWDLQARYLARACLNLLYSSSLTTVRIGAGISQVPGLIRNTNHYIRKFMNRFPGTLHRRLQDQDVMERARTAPDSSFIGAAIQANQTTGFTFSPYPPA
jgi:fructokinase